MNSLSSFQCWLPLLLIFSTSVAARQSDKTGLSVLGGTILQDPERELAWDSNNFITYFYNQTLDHFNYRPESYAIFQQRYVINYRYWGGPNDSAPIFAYLGAEAPLDLQIVNGVGFLTDNAPRFNALQIYIEHRYYGKSIPFGSREEAMKNASTLGYFNSAQAIADYAEVLLHVKKQLLAENAPVIVVGCSYGGMLASWFRLKYPHIALGALASSAPVLYFDDITPQDGFFSIITKDFKEASESCFETIQNSWSEIDKVSSEPNGLSILSQRFKTCIPLNESSHDLVSYLITMYIGAAQNNHPPTYPVTAICSGIDGASEGTDILSRIYAGVVSYKGNRSCYDMNEMLYSIETLEGWSWQSCSEMVIPIGSANDTMFPSPDPFDLNHFIQWCNNEYGVSPRPHWVTTYYGGHDIELILRRFASNIIFSNGLKDPWSSGGVLKNISDSVVAIYTINGSHCLDIHGANDTDPEWLVKQRETEVDIIKGWIANYYVDLSTFKNKKYEIIA